MKNVLNYILYTRLLAITWGDIGTSSLSPIENSTNVLPVTNASTAIEFPPITDNLTSSTNSLDANCNGKNNIENVL